MARASLEAPDDFVTILLGAGVHALAVSVEHAARVERLPWHHRDPVDRLLVAQATIERATLVSRDDRLHAYGVPLVW